MMMKTMLTKLKNDLYNVFIKGDSDSPQQARVFILLAIPFISVVFTFGQFSIY